MIFRISVEMLKHEFPSRKWKHCRNSWISEFPLTCWNMNFRQENESTAEIHEFPNFRWHPEKWISVKEMKALQKFMNFRISVDILKHEFPSRKWKHCRNSWISEFPLTSWKMNFRQGNESTAEIHEFLNFRWHPEKWISVKEMKALQKFMNFRISVDMLKTWISVKEMKALQKFMNFRISVDMLKTWISVKEMKALQKFMNFRISVDILKNEFPSRKWKHCRNSWISEFPLTCWKHEFPSRKWKHCRNSWISEFPLTCWKHEFPSRKWKHCRNSWISEFPLTCWKHEFPSRKWKHCRNSGFSEFPLTSWKHEFLSSKWHQKWINLRFSAERLSNINSSPETEEEDKFCFYSKKGLCCNHGQQSDVFSCRNETDWAPIFTMNSSFLARVLWLELRSAVS